MFKKILKFILKLFIALILLSVIWVIVLRFVPVHITPLMLIRSVEAKRSDEKPKRNQTWVPIEKISPHMVQAVIASEDNLFTSHNGFSIDDIQKAMEENKEGKRIRGGSTISQQTAKNVFLWPKRSYLRKGLEAYFTVLIELFWSKERIMEVYLNVIEMGNGIYGVEAAAQEYFNNSAEKLTRPQAALIAVCLPNPRKFNPAKPSAYILRRQQQILSLMNKIGPVELKKEKDKSKDKRDKKK